MNPLDIMRIESKFTIDEFLKYQELNTIAIFETENKEKKEVRPFCNLLLEDGSMLFTFLDLADDREKNMTSHRIKLLSLVSGAIAYVGVHEAFTKTMKDTEFEDDKLLKDLNYQISLLPDREEVLIMVIEYKKSNKIASKMIKWTIESTPQGRKLTNRNEVLSDKLQGRMTGIIIP
jgi:hypothetical protein